MWRLICSPCCLAALIPLFLFLKLLVNIFRMSLEEILRFLDATLRSFLFIFEFLQHRLHSFMIIVRMASLLCIVLPDLLIPLSDLCLSMLLLSLFHELLKHLLGLLLALLPQILLHQLIKSTQLGLLTHVREAI